MSTPMNGGYMVTAYVAIAAILLVYAASLWRRAKGEGRREERG
jgi:hypothetical protein